nr:SDR family NAD(P)-dependent oxidoreductase [Weissella confusa]
MTKTALVTGANKGIGFGIAKALLQQGYRVLVGARDEQRGSTAVEALRAYGDAQLQLIDVSDLNSIQTAVADITKHEADFSLLVNTLVFLVIWVVRLGNLKPKN